jgi:hypothetical protein
MKLRDIVAAPKSDIKIGAWRAGKVPKADFPIAKSPLRLGSSFQWCVITFQALSAEIRVLVLFNPMKEKYDAILGVMATGVVRVLCAYEYHATEPGWHVHATCDKASALPAGIFRGPWIRRIPAGGRHHRRKDFGIVDKQDALRFALDRYRIENKGPLL